MNTENLLILLEHLEKEASENFWIKVSEHDFLAARWYGGQEHAYNHIKTSIQLGLVNHKLEGILSECL